MLNSVIGEMGTLSQHLLNIETGLIGRQQETASDGQETSAVRSSLTTTQIVPIWSDAHIYCYRTVCWGASGRLYTGFMEVKDPLLLAPDVLTVLFRAYWFVRF